MGLAHLDRHRHAADVAAPAGAELRTMVPAPSDSRSRAARPPNSGLPAVLQAPSHIGLVLPGNSIRERRTGHAEIEEITPRGIRTADGREHEVDLLILATGFQPHNYMRPMNLRGRDGLDIDDAWAKGPRAYRMTAIPGFPNFFTVLGPNSPTGSISLQYSAELTASLHHSVAASDFVTARSTPSRSPNRRRRSSTTTSRRRSGRRCGTPDATPGISPTRATSICGPTTARR